MRGREDRSWQHAAEILCQIVCLRDGRSSRAASSVGGQVSSSSGSRGQSPKERVDPAERDYVRAILDCYLATGHGHRHLPARPSLRAGAVSATGSPRAGQERHAGDDGAPDVSARWSAAAGARPSLFSARRRGTAGVPPQSRIRPLPGAQVAISRRGEGCRERRETRRSIVVSRWSGESRRLQLRSLVLVR